MRIIHIVLSFLMMTSLHAEVVKVCNDCHVQTIKEAVELAQPHDTIQLERGSYECINLEISKPLTLRGSEGTILDGRHKGYILKVLSDSVSIFNLKFINAGKSYTKDFAAIYVFKANHFSIIDNEVVNPFFGLLIEKSKDGRVLNNFIHGLSKIEDDSGNGIHLWHCTNIEVKDNRITLMRDGIYLEFVDESIVSNNYAYDNVRYGLHFMFSNNDEYLNNVFENNGAGVAVMFSKYILMKDNQFLNNWGGSSYGLLLKEIYDAEVLDNKFRENTIAIFIDGTTRIKYEGNWFERNGWGIKVSGGCYANSISRNNFIGNSFDISYNSRINDNTFDGNYWSSYSGYDLDKNNVGDVPYRPVKLFSYVVNETPESIILLRSLFVDVINFSERVSPIFTPDRLIDNTPSMKIIVP